MDNAPWICNSCFTEYPTRVDFCTSCFRSGIVIANSQRPAARLVPSVAGVTARELARSDQSVFSLKAYPALKLAYNSFVTLTGGPGAGKTSMALRWAEALPPAVFLALEMGIGPQLAATLRRLEVRSEQLVIEEPRTVSVIIEIAERPGLRCLVVDSGTVCSLLPEDWLALARSKGIVVLATLQLTKDGVHAGSNRWVHDSDVNLHCENLSWRLTKSRFQEANLAGEVLCSSVNG